MTDLVQRYLNKTRSLSIQRPKADLDYDYSFQDNEYSSDNELCAQDSEPLLHL